MNANIEIVFRNYIKNNFMDWSGLWFGLLDGKCKGHKFNL